MLDLLSPPSAENTETNGTQTEDLTTKSLTVPKAFGDHVWDYGCGNSIALPCRLGSQTSPIDRVDGTAVATSATTSAVLRAETGT